MVPLLRLSFALSLLAAPLAAAASTVQYTREVNLGVLALCSGPTTTLDGSCNVAAFDERYVQRIYDPVGVGVTTQTVGAIVNVPYASVEVTGPTDPNYLEGPTATGFSAPDLLGIFANRLSTVPGVPASNTVYFGFAPDLARARIARDINGSTIFDDDGNPIRIVNPNTIGIAFQNGPPFALVESDRTDFSPVPGRDRRFQAALVAHELGHVLGVDHPMDALGNDIEDRGALMSPFFYPSDYSDPDFVLEVREDNATAMRQSPFLRIIPIPVPPSLPLLGVGMLLLALVARRARA